MSSVEDLGVGFVVLALLTVGEGEFTRLTLMLGIECGVTFTPSLIGVRGVFVFAVTV